MFGFQSPKNQSFPENIRTIKKIEAKSMFLVLKDLDEKVENYSHRTKELINTYSTKSRNKKFVFEAEPKSDFKKRIETLNGEIDKAEERTKQVLKMVAEYHRKKIML